MRVAICDDNKNDLICINKVAEKTLKSKKVNFEIKLYPSADNLLEDNLKCKFDVIFLDLDMPEINGMEVASKLNKLNEATEIVFVTNHDELVYKAYKFKALGFVRKKFLEEEFDEIADNLIESINLNCQFIVFSDIGKKYNVRDIIFMQSDDHYVDIVTDVTKGTVRDSLNSIEKLYSSYGFIRIHSRYLVNYRYIYSIESSTVVLTNKQQLPMSRSKSNSVKEAFLFFSRRL